MFYLWFSFVPISAISSVELCCVCDDDKDSSSPRRNWTCRGDSSRILFSRPSPTLNNHKVWGLLFCVSYYIICIYILCGEWNGIDSIQNLTLQNSFSSHSSDLMTSADSVSSNGVLCWIASLQDSSRYTNTSKYGKYISVDIPDN